MRSALSSAETEVAAHAEAYGRLADEKEELVRRGDELEQVGVGEVVGWWEVA